MSIQADINELNQIEEELSRMRKRMSQLRKQKEAVEQRVLQFLESKDQPGVKFRGKAILADKRTSRSYKNPKKKTEDGASILRQYGVHNADKVLDEIIEAMKGEKIEKEKLKIKKTIKEMKYLFSKINEQILLIRISYCSIGWSSLVDYLSCIP